MEQKINIAELLKDCPSGMELDCLMYENVTLMKVDDDKDAIFPIKVFRSDGCLIDFTKYGQYSNVNDAKCVIFPKGKTTWNGFQRPFKDGDILATDLGSVFYLNTRLNTDECYGCYVGIGGDGSFHICEPFAYEECCGFATEEEKQKLFDAIKANGYKWNAEIKTLEKLVKPQFKVGNVIQDKYGYKVKIIEVNVEDECYEYESIIAKGIGSIVFSEQNNWKLIPNKFDINTLIPFESRVLVRNYKSDYWKPAIFGFKEEGKNTPFCVEGGNFFNTCIPYEGNEHLRGTTNDCAEFYKTW